MGIIAPGTVTCFRGTDAMWHQQVLDACPSLTGGHLPPRWARSGHVQNALTVFRSDFAPAVDWDREDRLTMADGGTVSVQWLGTEAAPGTPVLVVLHTICGSGAALRRFLRSMQRQLGWVIAACNRRGHAGLELTAPQINTMGSTADLRRQIEAIEAQRPGATLYGVGVSAGSGLLVRYLGEEGAQAKLRAGVAVCPAYDIEDAFRYVDRRYDVYLTRSLKRFFLERHRERLQHVEGYSECAAARSLAEFQDRIYGLAGYTSRDAYYDGSNPMRVAREMRVPVLVINAKDDPVCVERNLHEQLDALQCLPRVTVALTRHGGHCGFHEGAGARANWADQAIAEYLRLVHRNTLSST